MHVFIKNVLIAVFLFGFIYGLFWVLYTVFMFNNVGDTFWTFLLYKKIFFKKFKTLLFSVFNGETVCWDYFVTHTTIYIQNCRTLL